MRSMATGTLDQSLKENHVFVKRLHEAKWGGATVSTNFRFVISLSTNLVVESEEIGQPFTIENIKELIKNSPSILFLSNLSIIVSGERYFKRTSGETASKNNKPS